MLLCNGDKRQTKNNILTSCSRHTSRWPASTIMMVTNHRRQRKASPSKLTGRLSITQLRLSRCSCHRHHQPHCQYDYHNHHDHHNHTCSQWYAVMIKSSHHSDLAVAVCYLFLQEGDSVFALDGLLGSAAKVNEMSENEIL